MWKKFIREFIGKKVGADSHSAFLPPPQKEVEELLASRSAISLKEWIREACEVKKEKGELQTLVLQARTHYGWPEDELIKLEIYIDYFADNVPLAVGKILTSALHEKDFDFFVIACIGLYLLDDFERAYTLLVQRNPNDVEFSAHMFAGFAGYIVLAAGRPISESLHYFDMAMKQQPLSLSTVVNAYGVYFEAGRQEVVDYLKKHIHERYARDPQALYALSGVELARGYFPEGFRLAESRYDHPESHVFMNQDLFLCPRWKGGGSISHQNLLIHAEQGLGDVVMCARFLPFVKSLAKTVMLECPEEAIALLKYNYPWVQYFSRQAKAAAVSGFDCWIGAMSLPHILDVTASSIPGKTGYLRAPPENVDYWRKRVGETTASNRLKVGFAWSGNPRHRADRRRSLPIDLLVSYLKKIEGIDFFSMQTSVPASIGEVLHDFSDELITLADTSALIQEMDLIITVDTSIVHMAGALGRRTWLLLPCRYDWRWGLEGETNPWYDSVRVIRQTSHGDWAQVLDKVFFELLPEFVAGKEAGNA